MTYNQEKYVREAVCSVLNQTYDNLEVIISDDCSSDNTWEIVESEVEIYRQNSGLHTRIILNRNKVNLGVARHFELLMSKSHGEIVVAQAGDDRSLPARVEHIVDAYNENPDATLFCHKAVYIDDAGHRTKAGAVSTSAYMPLGALMAYSSRTYTEFGPIVERDAFEDDVYARRAEMLGREVQVHEVLLEYRVGCGGISSGGGGAKVRRSRVARGCLASAKQSRLDILECKCKLDADVCARIKREIDRYEQYYSAEYAFYNARCIVDKIKAFKRLNKHLGLLPCITLFMRCTLPERVVSVLRAAKSALVRSGHE